MSIMLQFKKFMSSKQALSDCPTYYHGVFKKLKMGKYNDKGTHDWIMKYEYHCSK